ncbi:hypothetical protein [Frankia sp. Cas4]|uniref:hypothetical protein n=1 Tax=Frankia sp. Cas4 TaxID=3073927 RepID=UPI002AD35D43|nr:hypothetical protein [Frankia sp. Cas4]
MALSRAAAELYTEIGPAPSNCGALRKRLRMEDAQFDEAVAELVLAGMAIAEGRRIRRAPSDRTPPKASRDALVVFDQLPPDGTPVGGLRLRSAVRITNDRYRLALDELKTAGLVRLGRGRGGTIARADDVLQTPDDEVLETHIADAGFAAAGPGQLVRRESELYQPFVDWYQSEIDTAGLTFSHIRETASARRRVRASGQWSRPDVAAVEVWSSYLLPDVVLTISSFEIKRSAEANRLESLYEAAAHGRWAHCPSLVVETASEEDEDNPVSDRVLEELDRLKLGLYTMYNVGFGAFRVKQYIPPSRHAPDPGYLHDLLEYFFSDDKRQWEKYRLAIRR